MDSRSDFCAHVMGLSRSIMREVNSSCSEKGGADGDLLLLCVIAQSFKQRRRVIGIVHSKRGLFGHISVGGSLFDWRKRFFFPNLSEPRALFLFCRLQTFTDHTLPTICVLTRKGSCPEPVGPILMMQLPRSFEGDRVGRLPSFLSFRKH